jgi:hypothetical protein
VQTSGEVPRQELLDTGDGTIGDQTQELTDKINESITTLCTETDAAKQDETYRAWLRTLSRFYSYSFNNWHLIYTQRPDATRVAGFQTWKSLGRFVKKGERGICIFAPIIRKVEEDMRCAITDERTSVSRRCRMLMHIKFGQEARVKAGEAPRADWLPFSPSILCLGLEC